FWLSVFMLINLIQIGALLMERRGAALSAEEQALHAALFGDLPPVAAARLLRSAQWATLPTGQALAQQGAGLDEVVLVWDGEISIRRDGEEIARAQRGNFIGEMGFLSGASATATAVTATTCRCVRWSRDALEQLLTRDALLEARFHRMLATDLSAKLAPSH
ncbi:MAG: cyclic nucleotide-binding domain-containing protein, partial [Myxococcota bacterium]